MRLHDGAGWRTVASSRALPQGKWMVQFDDVADRNEAERLTGRVLWGNRSSTTTPSGCTT
ncbi:MAG: hypothetical protein R2713_00730 [Ilumatobacteraceae bacterium]